METLSCSLSLAFLAEVTGRGYQREGFSGFLRAITVTERAIARSVDCECPISAATSDSLRSSSVRAIALRLGNSLPYTDTSRLLPRPFFTLHPYDWERVTYHSTVVLCIWPAGLPEVVTRLVRIIQLILFVDDYSRTTGYEAAYERYQQLRCYKSIKVNVAILLKRLRSRDTA